MTFFLYLQMTISTFFRNYFLVFLVFFVFFKKKREKGSDMRVELSLLQLHDANFFFLSTWCGTISAFLFFFWSSDFLFVFWIYVYWAARVSHVFGQENKYMIRIEIVSKTQKLYQLWRKTKRATFRPKKEEAKK